MLLCFPPNGLFVFWKSFSFSIYNISNVSQTPIGIDTENSNSTIYGFNVNLSTYFFPLSHFLFLAIYLNLRYTVIE